MEQSYLEALNLELLVEVLAKRREWTELPPEHGQQRGAPETDGDGRLDGFPARGQDSLPLHGRFSNQKSRPGHRELGMRNRL